MRKYKNIKNKKRVDGKTGFTLEDPSDGIIEALNFADTDFFPNIRTLLIWGAISPIASTGTERAAPGIRQLKTPYRSFMGDKRKSALNLLHLQRISDIDIQSVAQMIISSIPEKSLRNLYYSKINCCWKQDNKRL